MEGGGHVRVQHFAGRPAKASIQCAVSYLQIKSHHVYSAGVCAYEFCAALALGSLASLEWTAQPRKGLVRTNYALFVK